ncbi:MAG: glycine cleavage system aminomethyltransferase GcvT [Candidatus Hydrogenedens sp.]|nr:glycine cleavage system aminomethyltransferase GcvT [Candidatus Hydrogenedens sp.]
MELRTTPLFECCKKAGGRFVDFHGWYLPVQFEGIISEHLHVRSEVGIFDCSHMGEFLIHGKNKISQLSYLTCGDFVRLPVGRCRYTALLNSDGSVLDDCVGLRINEETLYLITNAGVLEQVSSLLCNSTIGATDVSNETVKIDVQGPKSLDVLLRIGFGSWITELKYWTGKEADWKGNKIIVTRAGYTGELGYELFLPPELGEEIWELLIKENDVKPCGLGARDTLRTEMGYPLNGQDILPGITPLMASMERFIDWEHDFVGKDRLLKDKEHNDYRRLKGIKTNTRQAPRHGQKLALSDKEVGEVTSGTFGPSLGVGVGLALLDKEASISGTKLQIIGRYLEIDVCDVPIYQNGTARRKVL